MMPYEKVRETLLIMDVVNKHEKRKAESKKKK